MKIAICDDEKIFREKLYETLISCKTLMPNTSIKEFSSGNELVSYYSKHEVFDMVFLDIEMPGLSGLETGQRIREFDRDVIIIFLTSYKQYVFESFKIETFDYLIKPIEADAINDLLTRAVKKYQEQHYIVHLKWEGQHYALEVNKIVYVESYMRHTIFGTENEKYECIGKLDEYEAKLAPYGFLRCHQSFLINMKYIKSVEDNKIITITGTDVHMSFRRKKACLKSYNEYIARYRV